MKRLEMSGGRIRALAGAALVAITSAISSSAFAWKPQTHIYAANQAAANVYAGNYVVSINGQNYPVIPEVGQAIQNFPAFYRAGVCGPDAFPDIYVGQGFIHPDTRNDNGRDPNTAGDGHSYSYEWLRHIYQAGWSYYNAHNGNAAGQKILAFTYGFLTHAAGDMWAHTFVNNWAEGVFPGLTEFSDYPIAARHIVVESYVGDATPQTNLGLVQDSAELAEFQLWAMMRDSSLGGFVDSKGFDAKKLGRGGMFDFFYDLRAEVLDTIAFFESEDAIPLWIFDPITTGIVYAHLNAWVYHLDSGLEAWAYMSQDISVDLFQNGSFGDAMDEVTDYITAHLTYMLGVPDTLAFLFEALAGIFSLFDFLMEPLVDEGLKLANYLVSQAAGIDVAETIEYNIHPANHINSFLLGFSPVTSFEIDEQMGRTTPGTGSFNPNTFAPMYNTIQTSKLILLAPETLNQVLYDNRVGPMYTTGNDTDKENAMLGFIRTLDGHHQWRKHTALGYSNNPLGAQHGEGMLLWSDCLARDRVFRTIFHDWQNGNANFPALGENADQLSNTPAPDSTLTITGANVVVNGITYVGNTTTFKSNVTPTYFWNANEIQATGQYLPLGTLQTGTPSATFGPIDGPDGVYNLQNQGIGQCTNGEGHPGTLHSKSVTLDATPPTITVPVPTQNQVMDVNNTIVFDMNATDAGSGVETITATLDGQPILDGATIDSFFLTAGNHTIAVTATDKIGNTATYTRIFSVHATIQGLKSAVNRAYQMGLITKPTTQTALQQQLDSAQKALNKGDKANAANKVGAASQLVAGQLGNGVETVFGQRFIGWCTDLIQRLNTP